MTKATMAGAPLIPVPWGEVFDKIAILTLKAERLSAPAARAHAQQELAFLQQVAQAAPGPVPELQADLLAVNTRLWQIEDALRQHEAIGDFGPEFIKLARAVYHENDERARIKRTINQQLNSPLVEEKQYAQYDRVLRNADAP
jgi:hypothetical protein